MAIKTAAKPTPAETGTKLGTNIVATVSGTKLTLVIDTETRIGPSASGKTIIVATSSGNVEIPGVPGMKLGLNLYVPNK